LRAVHHAADHQGSFLSEEIGEKDRTGLKTSSKFSAIRPPGRQRTSSGGHAFDVPPELDLFGEQQVAGSTVVGGLV
jgi:hypothetical protein